MVAATLDGGSFAPNRAPKVTADFWLVNLLSVTVGETVAGYMSFNLGFGLSTTAWITSIALAVVMILQFQQRRYVPWIYWTAIVLIGMFAALISDDLVDDLGAPLATAAAFFAIALVMVFALWSLWEETLSTHSIVTTRREVFYWLAVLFTFALGTALDDLIAAELALGLLLTGLLFAAAVCFMWLCHRLGASATLCFWPAYALIRPLGSSFGDLLSEPRISGGLGLGATATSLLFLACIIMMVAYMTWSHDGEEFAAAPH